MKIELHLLQNFPPSCLNRDETGQPKDCEFGGYRRARISSQCIKRSIRKDFKESNRVPPENRAARTKRVLADTAKILGKDVGDVRNSLEAAIKTTFSGKDKSVFASNDLTEYLYFVSEGAIQRFAESLEDPKRAGQELMNAKGLVDLALFGRMLANAPDHRVDASCQVAHAISTNRVAMEFDYFTALDDLKPDAEPQADMIGTVGYNSSCFYRYSVVDFDQLVRNLLGGREAAAKATAPEHREGFTLARTTVEAFLHASVAAIPTGKQNTFAAHSRPGFILAIVRDSGVPVNLANAFLRPVQPRDWGKEDERRDLLAASAEALSDHWTELTCMYTEEGIRARGACWMPKDLRLPVFDAYRDKNNSFNGVVSAVMDALPQEV